MTWSTHKTKVNLLYGFVVFHEIIVCSTALFNIQRNSFPNKIHFSKSIVETVFFYAWENIATIMNFWITLLNDFFHDNRLHFIGIFTSTLRLIWPLFTLLGSGSEWQKPRRKGPSIKDVGNFWPFLTPYPPHIDLCQLLNDPSLKKTSAICHFCPPPIKKEKIR